MNKKIRISVVTLFALTLGGCNDQAKHETPPVVVKTKMGPVIRQLYKLDRVQWDEAATVPEGMSITTGDKICQAKGHNIITDAKRRSNLSRRQ